MFNKCVNSSSTTFHTKELQYIWIIQLWCSNGNAQALMEAGQAPQEEPAALGKAAHMDDLDRPVCHAVAKQAHPLKLMSIFAPRLSQDLALSLIL